MTGTPQDPVAPSDRTAEPALVDPDDGHVGTARSITRSPLAIAAMGSAAAGLVHTSAAGTHTGDRALVVAFSLCAAVQVGWAALVVAHPTRRVALLGAALNGAAIVVWLLTRTVGIAFIEPLAEVEAIGAPDLAAAAFAAVAVVFALVTVPSRAVWKPVWSAVAAVAVLVLAVPAMAADHTHGDAGHPHDETAAADGHVHDDGATSDDHDHDEGAAGAEHGHDQPVTSLDDPSLTDDQHAAAQALIDETRTALAAFPDVPSVEAAGYTSIGDGRTGFEHYINWELLADGNELEPAHIESIVFAVEGAEATPVSAMYILEDGKTMDDVPDVAGPLTTWHDHTNLCWDTTGTRLNGVLVGDRCIPRGELWVTPPMLHVWLEDQPCGPFAGLEGHGGDADCSHEHTDEAAAGTSAGGGGHDHEMPARLDHEPTDAQLGDARELIDETTDATARYADVADAEAAGFASIGDGRSGFEHYVNAAWNADEAVLDPERPESLVYEVAPDGSKRLATVMYILPKGSTMDDVPDIAGNLTMWHAHDNLCFDPATQRLSGFQVDGRCVPGGTPTVTAPMLHVWVTPNPCGPFAGTDAGQMTGSCEPDLLSTAG